MTDIERVFVRFRGRTIGPMTPDKVKDMVRRGQVTRLHELSGDGLSWMKADEFGNFFPRAVTSGGMAGDMAATASSVPPGGSGGAIAEDDGAVAPTPNENATAQWYAHVNGEKQGPVSMDQMCLYAEAKILKKDSLVWRNGMDAWKPAAQALPELFGGAGVSGSTVVSPSAADEQVSDGGALSTELLKHHAMILALGVSLLVIGLIILAGQVVSLNQTGAAKNSDLMSAALRISMSCVAAIAGVLALQAATKMKTAAESSSPIATLIAARAVNQFWFLSSISVMVWLVILLLVIIVALATNVPVTNVLV
jgi:hypothetical protein